MVSEHITVVVCVHAIQLNMCQDINYTPIKDLFGRYPQDLSTEVCQRFELVGQSVCDSQQWVSDPINASYCHVGRGSTSQGHHQGSGKST